MAGLQRCAQESEIGLRELSASEIDQVAGGLMMSPGEAGGALAGGAIDGLIGGSFGGLAGAVVGLGVAGSIDYAASNPWASGAIASGYLNGERP